LDLYTTFGSYDELPKFTCSVGIYDYVCSGVKYYGDNILKKNSKTTEVISLDVIGRHPYLVYVSRYAI